jgi:hypothetical protein
MDLATQIAAARRFAPPLTTIGRADRRGARVRLLNRRAVDYAKRAGLGVWDVYPEGLMAVQAMAPEQGSAESGTFAAAAGLELADVYFGSEVKPIKRRWCWSWAAVGVLVGAALVGPIGAVVGLAGGLLRSPR